MDQLENFLKDFSAARHHIDSYNRMITHDLPLLFNQLDVQFAIPDSDDILKLSFENVTVSRACALINGKYEMTTPAQCRREDSCYMAPVFVSVYQRRIEPSGRIASTFLINRATVAQLPVMLGSTVCSTTTNTAARAAECPYDKGGYFIINGVERVLVTQQRIAYNVPQVLEEKGNFLAQLRSMSEETGHSALISALCSALKERDIDRGIWFKVPSVNDLIPVEILLRAFGLFDEQEVMDALGIKHATFNSCFSRLMRAHPSVQTQEDALEWIGARIRVSTHKAVEEVDDDPAVLEEDTVDDVIADELPVEEDYYSLSEEDDADDDESSEEDEEEKIRAEKEAEEREMARQKRIACGQQVIDSEMFPHLGIRAAKETKLAVVFNLLRRLLLTKWGYISPGDRDHIAYKRFENSGILIYDLFKLLLKNFVGTVKDTYGRAGNMSTVLEEMNTFITKSIRYCFSTGKWGVQKSYIRQGVSQVLTRLSYLSVISHLQRISIPVSKEAKNVKIRQIHPSQFGFICLYETPEGKACGIVLNMTLSCNITQGVPTARVKEVVERFCADLLVPNSGTCVWINQTVRLFTLRAREFIERMLSLRAARILPFGITFLRDRFAGYEEIQIYSDKGRIIRPLLNEEQKVMWCDPAELESVYVRITDGAPDGKPFYREIHPSLLMGACAASIPFSDHNQSPRNVYESSMMKQAIGLPACNVLTRGDTLAEVLDYPQKCIVSTAGARAIGMHDMPAGINCVVAICTMGGWNGEDSTVWNRAFFERGGMMSTSYKTLTVYEYKQTNGGSVVRRIKLPAASVRDPRFDYSHLDERGIIRPGTVVSKKDVLVGRVREVINNKEISFVDCSELSDEKGTVESADLFLASNGYNMAKIVLKIRKAPERGDKFANLSAQKGTCGAIFAPEDLPFTSEGMIPDVLINPNALPSRMTISMLLEMVLGKECALDARLGDATAFSENSTGIADKLGGVLLKHGFDPLGSETLYSGTTGKPMRARIFMGTTYYQKLKHMVHDKMHARATGNVSNLTRQPVAGRSKDGGMRMGEMERDNLLGQGLGAFTLERLFHMSDDFTVLICRHCKVISNHKDECHECHGTELLDTNLPYASKLLFQILNATCIKAKMGVEQW